MAAPRKYASYADFEKDEFLRVRTFYENLEDIMEEELFSHYDEPGFDDGEEKFKSPAMDLEL